MKITINLTEEQAKLFTADHWTAEEYRELNNVAKDLISEALRKATK